MATVTGTVPNVVSDTDVALYPASAFTAAPTAGAAIPAQSAAAGVLSSPDGTYTFQNIAAGEYYAAAVDNTGTSAFVHVYASEESLRVPQFPTASLPTLGTGDGGATVYDTTAGKLKVWVGSAWQTVTSA